MEYLAISVIGDEGSKILNEISKLATKNECNIISSHLATMGSNCALAVMVEGNWSGVAKLEAGLGGMEKKYDISMLAKRTQLSPLKNSTLPYNVQIIALDQPGIIYEITDFFLNQNIALEECKAFTYETLGKTSLFSLNMNIQIPSDISIADLREQFLLFCDELNLDGIIEPVKRFD